MRVLLSTIGSRGDVQPLVALALALRRLDQDVRLCVPPDFRERIEGLGFPVTPIGPELRTLTAGRAASAAPITPEQRRQMIEGTVAAQFETIAAAAEGCDVIVGATALQIAAPSIAEKIGVPYVFAAYCPRVIPSPRHPPIPLGPPGQAAPPADTDNRTLWENDALRWNQMWGPLLNARRQALGLAPVDDVLHHVITARPWLAADPTLGPWPDPADHSVFQTGAWLVADERPLPAELEAFLNAGEPPVYFGFGSIRAPAEASRAMIEAARACGRGALVSRGWANLALVDDQPDCLAIGDVNHGALFRRVAAVVHHGGAGTTTTAARAGVAQVIVPQMYDQPYWSERVAVLGIGVAHAQGAPTAASLTAALAAALRAETAHRARAVAARVSSDGAEVAARRLLAVVAA